MYDHPTPTDHSNAWKWQRFGCGLTFKHFYLVASNLLPKFLIIVTHSNFNIMSSVIPLNKNGGSGEKNAQVKILIQHLLRALRDVYKKTGIVDNPVSIHILRFIYSMIYIDYNNLPTYISFMKCIYSLAIGEIYLN